MTVWEKIIVDTLIRHYFASAEGKSQSLHKQSLRLRTSILFPNFDNAHHEEKVSYLEAAESLERKGVVKLRWEKRRKGERLVTISCNDFEVLFASAGKPHPENEEEKIRTFLNEKIIALKNYQSAGEPRSSLKTEGSPLDQTKNLIIYLEFFLDQISSREIGQGTNQQTIDELIRLFEFACDENKIKNITVRALSILLYNDSKHLEHLLTFCSSLLSRIQKTDNPQDFIFPQRSYPEAAISGKILFEIKNSNTPLINEKGLIITLPLESAKEISFIKSLNEKQNKTVLTIENKETFYAIGSPNNNAESENISYYDCFLYTGGYPNSAVSILIKTLASSGFSFYHAGDIDPDGILIFQNIQDIINSVCPEKIVTPIKMNISTFDQYREWARPLTKASLHQTKKIREGTRNISGLAALIKRIEETGLGVEQEIIDYR